MLHPHPCPRDTPHHHGQAAAGGAGADRRAAASAAPPARKGFPTLSRHASSGPESSILPFTARHPSAAARQAIAIGLNFPELWMQGARPASPESVAVRARYRMRRRSHVNVTGRRAIAPIAGDRRPRRGLSTMDGGPSRNRTGVYGFAVRCVTTPPSGLRRRIAWRQRP